MKKYREPPPVTRAEGFWRVNGDLPPLSRDARALTIVIPELAGQEGPWVFLVPFGRKGEVQVGGRFVLSRSIG